MAYKSFLSWYQEQNPVVIPPSSPAPTSTREHTEKRDFDMKNAELQRLFVWGKSDDGVVVNDETVLGSTPFFGAMRYVSEGVAMLDRRVKTLVGERYYDDKEHPISYLFRSRPHPYYTWFDLLCAWISNAMLGNGYIRIFWDRFTGLPTHLEHIPSRYCYPEFDSRGFLWYRITGDMNGLPVSLVLPHTDILHLKGPSLNAILGLSTSVVHQNAHFSSLASDDYTKSVFGKGAFPSIAVKVQESLDASEVSLMEENIMKRIGGSKQAGRPLVLDNGSDVQYLQWSPVDVALQAVKHLSVEQVSQLTKVPRDLLGLDNQGTLGATVQRSKDFYVHCLQPWVEKVQEEITTKLFNPTEVALGLAYFEFDPSLYLSMTPKEQAEMFKTAISSSQMTPNEARSELGRDPLPGGDVLFGDINLLPLENLVEVALAKYLSSEGEKKRGESDSQEPNSSNNSEIQNDTDNEAESQPAP